MIGIIGTMTLERLPQYLGNIENFINQGLWNEIKQTAHTLKGVLGNFAAQPAVVLAQQIEQFASPDTEKETRERLELLKEEVRKFQPALAAFLASGSVT